MVHEPEREHGVSGPTMIPEIPLLEMRSGAEAGEVRNLVTEKDAFTADIPPGGVSCAPLNCLEYEQPCMAPNIEDVRLLDVCDFALHEDGLITVVDAVELDLPIRSHCEILETDGTNVAITAQNGKVRLPRESMP